MFVTGHNSPDYPPGFCPADVEARCRDPVLVIRSSWEHYRTYHGHHGSITGHNTMGTWDNILPPMSQQSCSLIVFLMPFIIWIETVDNPLWLVSFFMVFIMRLRTVLMLTPFLPFVFYIVILMSSSYGSKAFMFSSWMIVDGLLVVCSGM